MIETLLHLLCRHLVGAKIVEVVLGIRQPLVGFFAHFEVVCQIEQLVLLVLNVVDGQRTLGLGLCEVGLEVEESRLYRLHLRVLYLLDKCALHVAVGRNGCD